MRLLLLKYWDRIRASFWFLPALMAAGAILLSYGSGALDAMAAEQGGKIWEWFYTGSADGARAVLTAISGSMITIAGLVFSMTLVAMSLAASSFGPRLLQNFMRDTTNQVVLGTFVATFLYCLLVLRTIRREDGGDFVPHVSVSLCVALALASLGVLIYFIHHVSVSIQADEIITRVTAELIERLDTLFPEQIGEHGPRKAESDADLAACAQAPEGARPVASREDGYVQMIDADALIAIAKQEDVLIHIEHRPGAYVSAGGALVRVSPGVKTSPDLEGRINEAFVIGNQRTATQDFEHLIAQIVEVAVRALSPGINDPFTAASCVDRLGSVLKRVAGREIPSPLRRDEDGQVRVVAPVTTFPMIAEAAFSSIRRYGRSSVEVSTRLLETIAAIAPALQREEDREALQQQASLIARSVRKTLPTRADRDTVRRSYEKAMNAL